MVGKTKPSEQAQAHKPEIEALIRKLYEELEAEEAEKEASKPEPVRKAARRACRSSRGWCTAAWDFGALHSTNFLGHCTMRTGWFYWFPCFSLPPIFILLC